jgi:dTDP-glucose 4,6-dehydratase
MASPRLLTLSPENPRVGLAAGSRCLARRGLFGRGWSLASPIPAPPFKQFTLEISQRAVEIGNNLLEDPGGMKIIVTGGAGFIGSALIRYLVENTEIHVLNIDKLTYAADRRSLASIEGHARYAFQKLDICARPEVERLVALYQPDAIMNLAAETHVDRSIDEPGAFLTTNIIGTYAMLEAAFSYWRGLPYDRQTAFRFHHVSTDEVFGSLGMDGAFSETTPYAPTSPYAASKASADHLVRAWHHTYGLPIIISHASNNYGAYQFPEKLIPLMITNALDGEELPIYGRGENIRDWLFVTDHAKALHQIVTRGQVGESYNVGGGSERTNLAVVEGICATLDEICPAKNGRSYRNLIRFVADRPGHDLRYALDCTKLNTSLSFRPSVDFEQGLRLTIAWYLANESWWRPLMKRDAARQRLGLSKANA